MTRDGSQQQVGPFDSALAAEREQASRAANLFAPKSGCELQRALSLADSSAQFHLSASANWKSKLASSHLIEIQLGAREQFARISSQVHCFHVSILRLARAR